jgi:hypothetical protein
MERCGSCPGAVSRREEWQSTHSFYLGANLSLGRAASGLPRHTRGRSCGLDVQRLGSGWVETVSLTGGVHSCH